MPTAVHCPSRITSGDDTAYATVNAYFDTQRQNALLILTMVAGLASTIFVPVSSLLITHLGWAGNATGPAGH